MTQKQLSGPIFYEECRFNHCGYMYTIRRENGQGWGIPTDGVSPDDFRALADHLEKAMIDEKRSSPLEVQCEI